MIDIVTNGNNNISDDNVRDIIAVIAKYHA